MKKVLSLFIFSFFLFSLAAQNIPKAIKENRVKLFEYSQKYVDTHADDKKAFDMHTKYSELKKSYEAYLNKISNGSYNAMGLRDQADFEKQNMRTDSKGKAMAVSVNRTFEAYKLYFREVSIPFRNQVTLFRSELRSGRYGKKGSSQRN